MIVDTSAIVAIAKGQPDDERCSRALQEANVVRLSAANLLECYMVLDRSDLDDASTITESILNEFSIVIEPVTSEQVAFAREAFHRFGTGNQQGAGLNYGDCFAYALARQTGEPLLFVGNDSAKTDLEPG